MSEIEKHIEYWANGYKKSEGTLLDGKEDGLWTYWDEKGEMSEEGTFKDGKKDGLWTYWDERGQKESEITFKDGEQIYVIEFDEDGNEIDFWAK